MCCVRRKNEGKEDRRKTLTQLFPQVNVTVRKVWVSLSESFDYGGVALSVQ